MKTARPSIGDQVRHRDSPCPMRKSPGASSPKMSARLYTVARGSGGLRGTLAPSKKNRNAKSRISLPTAPTSNVRLCQAPPMSSRKLDSRMSTISRAVSTVGRKRANPSPRLSDKPESTHRLGAHPRGAYRAEVCTASAFFFGGF